MEVDEPLTDAAPMDDLTDDEVMEDLIDDLEDLEETVESSTDRRVLRRTIATLGWITNGRIFGIDDLAQQIVGGFLLSGAFVVTEEVWDLAARMNWIQWAITVVMVFAIGYGALYKAADEHRADSEEVIGGLPVRFVSLMLVSYLSVAILAFVFGAPSTFGHGPETTLKAISLGAIFSVVGAASADSLF